MLIPTLIMATLAVVLLYMGYNKGGGQHIAGLKRSFDMTLEILPLLVCAFIVAGMVQELLPKDIVSKWVGTESGLRGILIGALAGGLTPGGPYVSMPIAAGFLRAGASIGTMVAFMTGWSVWAFNRLPMEIGVLGWKFSLIRITCSLVLPPIAGLIAQLLFSNVKV